MKLTPTQKNFRKQMKQLKAQNEPLSYRKHKSTVNFYYDNEPKPKKKFGCLKTLLITALSIYIIKNLVFYIIGLAIIKASIK